MNARLLGALNAVLIVAGLRRGPGRAARWAQLSRGEKINRYVAYIAAALIFVALWRFGQRYGV